MRHGGLHRMVVGEDGIDRRHNRLGLPGNAADRFRGLVAGENMRMLPKHGYEELERTEIGRDRRLCRATCGALVRGQQEATRFALWVNPIAGDLAGVVDGRGTL